MGSAGNPPVTGAVADHVDRLLLVLAVLTAAGAAGSWLRVSGRRLGTPATDVPSTADRLTAEDLGGALGERATLVQFSTSFCAPCRATRQLLARVSGQVDGVRHVEVDAEARLELVRRLDVRRTPTVLVLDRTGRVVRRASGQPRYADVVAAVGSAVEARP